MVVRFGEWDTFNTSEPLPYQEAPVQTAIIHPQYYSTGLYNDVALLILLRPVNYAINVRPICLPTPGRTFAPGKTCYASGWGRSAFGKSQSKQSTLNQKFAQKVLVTIWQDPKVTIRQYSGKLIFPSSREKIAKGAWEARDLEPILFCTRASCARAENRIKTRATKMAVDLWCARTKTKNSFRYNLK